MVAVRLTSLVVAVVLVLPACALGADGAVVDPDSPAGKEYAVPLAAARGQGQGEAPTTGATSPPPFGLGVSAARTRGRGVAGADRAPDAVGETAQPAERRSPAQRAAQAAVVRRTAAVPTSDGAPAWPTLAALGLVMLGAGTGLLLRARRGS